LVRKHVIEKEECQEKKLEEDGCTDKSQTVEMSEQGARSKEH
jgi:hypothetical protein